MSEQPRSNEKGEALPELILVLPILIFAIAALAQIAALTWTKSIVNYAAFAAARSVTVFGWQPAPLSLPGGGAARLISDDLLKIQVGWVAAAQVIGDFGDAPDLPLGITFPCRGGGWSLACVARGRQALTVTYSAPLGRPVFTAERLRITGVSPYVIQHERGETTRDIPEEGDNAAR